MCIRDSWRTGRSRSTSRSTVPRWKLRRAASPRPEAEQEGRVVLARPRSQRAASSRTRAGDPTRGTSAPVEAGTSTHVVDGMVLACGGGMTGWFADIRIALRLLRRRPGWTASVLATLALAIGANSALFSVLDAALLQPLPYPAPERLLLIGETAPSFPQMSVSYPDYVDWRARTRSFDEMGVFRGAEANLTGVGAPRRAKVIQASASYFHAIGVPPLTGRTFEEDEDRPGGTPVVVLSEALARKLYGHPGAALGQSLQVDGTASTVVGVMSSSFRVDGRPELWIPVGQKMVGRTAARGNHPGLTGITRLRRGVGFGEGRLDLE